MAAINQRRVRRLLEQAEAADSTTAKGQALEEAAAYVFGQLPGVFLKEKRVRDIHGSREIDLFFVNRWTVSGMGFLEWGLIVECKNLMDPVGYGDVVVFKDLLFSKNARSGILVAAGGISGTPGMYAHHAVEAAQQSGCTIIVVDRQELQAVRDTDALRNLLEEKYMRLKAYGTI